MSMLMFVLVLMAMVVGIARRGCSWRALWRRRNLFGLHVFFPEKRHAGAQGRGSLLYSVAGSKESQREGEAE